MAKAPDLPYEPGQRSMVTVKRLRTVDCVVAGVRVHADGGVASVEGAASTRDAPGSSCGSPAAPRGVLGRSSNAAGRA